MRKEEAGRPLRGRASALAIGLATCGLLAPAVALGDTPGQPQVVRFTTAGCSTWTVPAGVTTVHAQAVGAAGGGSSMSGDLGGRGDGFAATLSGLAGGQELDICVDYGGGSTITNGLGGGASGVALGSTFAAPVLVAAGGGGAGYDAGGGNAGFPAGDAGGDWVQIQGSGGGGGSQTAGGAAGRFAAPPDGDGARFDTRGPGTGGTGDSRAGAGGAGYFGGGGGAISAGGGGGSDFCGSAPTVSDCTQRPGAGTDTGAGAGSGQAQVILTYTVPGSPSVHVATPAAGASYQQGQAVRTSFTCAEGHDGPGIASCQDATGRPSGSPLDTAALGTHTFTVTAVSRDGLTTTASVTYTVLAPPTPPATPPPSPPAPKPPASAPPLRLTRFHQSHTRWREHGEHVTKKQRHRPIGTTFSFRLNQKAKTTLTITTRKPGRRVKHHCAPKTHENRHARHCTRTVTAGRLHHTGHRGRNTIHFAGKLPHHHTLRPGTYHARLTARAHQHKATSRRLTFKVL